MNQIAEYVKFLALAGSRTAQLRARLRRWALPTGTVVQRVPVALLQGVRKDPADLHFGNNISLKPGHYLIVVKVKRTTATFAVALAS